MLPLSTNGTDFSSFCTEKQFGCIEMTVMFIVSTLRLFINSIIYLKRGNYKKYNFPFLIIIINHGLMRNDFLRIYKLKLITTLASKYG